MDVRPPYFALQGWYRADEGGCRQDVESYLRTGAAERKTHVAGIVPHAGWLYSGAVAGRTFAAMGAARPDVLFLFGGHMRPGDPVRCMPRGAFGTPLGPVPVHEALAADLLSRFRGEEESAEHFVPDNTIELQFPFVKAVWPDTPVVALQVPPGSQAEEIGTWAAETASAQGLDAVAIGSTDLTHYGVNYGFTPMGVGEEAHRWSKEENDRPFIDRVRALDASGSMEHALDHHSACCPGATGAVVTFARLRGATEGELLQHTTSHEVAKDGPPRMWVGYAALAF